MYQIGKGEPKPKMGKMAPKARKPQAAKNGPKKPFPCDQCEGSFDRAGKLKIHVDSVHLGLKPLKGSQCDEAFSQKNNLTQHIKSAHENAVVCPTCNKTLSSKNRLREHIESVHEGIRHKCDFCDSTYSEKTTLAKHIKSAHKK